MGMKTSTGTIEYFTLNRETGETRSTYIRKKIGDRESWQRVSDGETVTLRDARCITFERFLQLEAEIKPKVATQREFFERLLEEALKETNYEGDAGIIVYKTAEREPDIGHSSRIGGILKT